MSDNETLADIIDEIRSDEAASVLTTGLSAHDMKQQLNFWADRIEAAAKRDAAIHAMTCEANERLREHLAIALEGKQGNAAAMREALKAAKTLLENTDFDADSDLDDAAAPVMAQIAVALAAPPRNCDVGTPETQVVRMAAYCRSHQDTEVTLCKRCPIKCDNWFLCALRWAQMPYEEGGAE